MSTPFSAAAAAYNQAQRLVGNAGKTTPQPAVMKPQGPDFGELVAQNIQSVVDAGKQSDKMSMDMVNGKADVVDVVTAISQTEVAMESMVAVRDRVIQAYEEIMRMPI